MKITLTPNSSDKTMIEVSSRDKKGTTWVWGMLHDEGFNDEILSAMKQNGAANVDLTLSKEQP